VITKKLVLATLCTALITPVTRTGGMPPEVASGIDDALIHHAGDMLQIGIVGGAAGALQGITAGYVAGYADDVVGIMPRSLGSRCGSLLTSGLLCVGGLVLNHTLLKLVNSRTFELSGIDEQRLGSCFVEDRDVTRTCPTLLNCPELTAALALYTFQYLSALGSYGCTYLRRVAGNRRRRAQRLATLLESQRNATTQAAQLEHLRQKCSEQE